MHMNERMEVGGGSSGKFHGQTKKLMEMWNVLFNDLMQLLKTKSILVILDLFI